MYSQVAALLFKLEAVCRLGYTITHQEHHCLASGTRASRQRYNFIICEEIDHLQMILFPVTPAELIDVEFIKPKHSKILNIKMTQVFCQPRG